MLPVGMLLLALPALGACGGGEAVNESEANDLAAEYDAGANEATDETQAKVLRDRANSLREVNDQAEVRDGPVTTGQ